MFDKVLIANRGEIALRIIRTCREMGIESVAVYSDVDRESLHVQAADSGVHLGPDTPAESYLNIDKIVRAARDTGAQAVHPGYGFLAESAAFAEACERAGLVFIGPPAKVLAAVGDKLAARRIAEKAKVPVTPGTSLPADKKVKVADAAAEIGFPVMLKAAAGGGGKGMRRVDRAEDLPEAIERAGSEAEAAFADGTLYLEKCVVDPRHVEVQILADQQGNVVHLFERECSIQRRHQKIIEEAPSAGVDEDLRRRLGEAAVAVARAAGYRNAGTVEFLVDQEGNFSFMEVNARIQVEHPVTEFITGIDLVEQQMRLAAGEDLAFSQAEIVRRGHAIECRIYAEDPLAGFMPSPGRIVELQAPAGPEVRFDCGVESGSVVPVEYDPILAKLVTAGADRQRAIDRMLRALSETCILGVQTPVELLHDIVGSEPFRLGKTNTSFLETHFHDWAPAADRLRNLLLGWLAAEEAGGDPGHRQTGLTTQTVDMSAVDPWQRLGAWRMER